VTDILALIDDSTSTIKARLTLKSNANGDASFVAFNVTSITTHASYYELNGAFVDGVGFSNNEIISFDFTQTGNVGATGPTGPTGVVTATAPITYNSGTQTVGIDLTNIAQTNVANTFSVGGHVVNNTVAGTIPFVIRGASAQTADMFLIRNLGGTTQFRVDPNGMTIANSLGVAGSPSGIAYAYFNTPVAGAKAVVVRSAASQTASVFETQDVSGTTRFYVDAAHNTNFSSASWVQNSTGRLTVGLTSATAVGVTVRGAASQTANLFEAQTSAGSPVFTIDPSGIVRAFNAFQGTGFLNTSGQTVISIASQRNVGLATGSGSYGGGQATVFIGNATVVPTSNPTGGGVLYVDAGALKYRGTSGTVTTIANA
jgi:hypothetical protein